MKLAKREKILFVITVLSICIALYQYGYKSFQGKRTSLISKLNAAQTELINQTKVLSQISQTRTPSSVEAQEESVKSVLEKAMNENKEFTKLMEELVRNANSQNVEVLKLTLESTDHVDSIVRARYRMELRAPFMDLGSLIEKLEKSDLILEIESIDLKRDGSDMRQVFMSAKINSYIARGG